MGISLASSWLAGVTTSVLTVGLSTTAFAVELEGRAVLPAATFSLGPVSGQLITSSNGQTAPFVSQPVQGISAVLFGPKPGTFLVMSDNGYGGKGNSPDFVLRFYGVKPDFLTKSGGSGQVLPVSFRGGGPVGAFTRETFLELNDGLNQSGFPLVAQRTSYPGTSIPVDPTIKRRQLLTGGDFDIEAFRQTADKTFWVGDEFGPFLLHFSATGQLLEPPFQLPNILGTQFNDPRPVVQSPDNPFLAGGANLGGSRGFEGMALSVKGDKLYTLLEGPLTTDPNRSRLLINEFDLQKKQFTNRVFFYRMENTTASGQSIGDMTAINESEFLIIERDSLQGDPNKPGFTNPAKFKRIYKINLDKLDQDGFVEKVLLVDLLNIADPNGLGGNGTTNGVFTFPFVTIESVLPINPRTLLVINDNNYPFSVGRTPGKADDNEFVLIRLDAPLQLVGYPADRSDPNRKK